VGKKESPFSGLTAELGRLRWKGKSKEEKTAHALMMNEARMETSTPEERSAAASAAAKARWDAVRAAKKKAVKRKP
jgi:hypothetical protein